MGKKSRDKGGQYNPSDRRWVRERQAVADRRRLYLRGPEDCEWRELPVSPVYEVSEYGDIRRKKPTVTRSIGHVLKANVSRHGYFRYKIVLPDGKKQSLWGHRAVITAFVGPPPTERHEVAHNDGNRQNNHYENLRWATRKENHDDRYKHNTDPRGIRNGRAKLCEADVLEIRKVLANPARQKGERKALRERLGVCDNVLSNVMSGKRWGHVRA